MGGSGENKSEGLRLCVVTQAPLRLLVLDHSQNRPVAARMIAEKNVFEHGRGRTVQAVARELKGKRPRLPGFDSVAIATMHGLASKCCLGYRKVGIEIGVNYAVSARD